jgi:uncharacterized repeat protein (TIGR01451 family)
MVLGRVPCKGLALFGALFLVSVAGLLAVHDDGLFELGDPAGTPGSADILGAPEVAGCDWADLFDADPTEEEIAAAVETCGGLEGAFVADHLAVGGAKDDTSFAKGSSKNDDPIALWRWSTGNAPAKDDLSNFYAYATLNEFDELILYAGVERLAPQGSSHIDFEFNQSLIGLDKDPPCRNDRSDGPDDGSPCEFTGEKVLDDILVVMDFENGGELGIVEVRQWDGTAYVIVDQLDGEGCNTAHTVCALNNGGPIDGGPWPNYDDHANVVETIDGNGFTEAGINITALLGETPCFATLQAKSRSSASYSSELKDFAQASFEICSIEVTKGGQGPTGEPLSKLGDLFTFSYEIENTGGGPLALESVEDSLLGDLTQEATSSGCSLLNVGELCIFDVVTAIPEDQDDPIDTSVQVSYVSAAVSPSSTAGTLVSEGALISAVTASDDLQINLFQPAVTVEKTGDTLSTAGNEVSYTITITNDSSDDSPDLANGAVIDTLLGDLLDPANPHVDQSTCTSILPTGGSCIIEAVYTVQPDDPDPLTNIVDVTYNPAGGFPNIITSSAAHDVDLVAPSALLTLVGSPAAAFPGDVVTYTYTLQNTGDVTLNRVSVDDTLLGDVTISFPASLLPGEPPEIVALERQVQQTDPNPLANEVTVVYQVEGLPNLVTLTERFEVEILTLCALSPGFWQGGNGVPKWDDISTDYIAQGAGFDTGTVFPHLDPSLAGTTYLGVLNLSREGDVTRQIGFKYIPARLNQVVFGVPADTAALLNSIDAYLAAYPVGSDPGGRARMDGEALFSALNGYYAAVGEVNCPPPDSF